MSANINGPGYDPRGQQSGSRFVPGGTNEEVKAPGGYLFGGQSIVYAPGYSAYEYDPKVIYANYNDQSIEQTRRMYLTSPEQALSQQRLMAAAGYGSADDVDGLWSQDLAGQYAKAMTDANGQYMSLNDYLMVKAGYKSARDAAKAGSRGRGSGGPTTSTSVNKSIRLTSRASAQALLKQTLSAELGREPTSKEVARFVAALNKDERANPTVSTTTSRTNGSNSSSSTVTKESQIDPGSEAEKYAETVNPTEAHRYQSGNYYDVIARLVGGN